MKNACLMKNICLMKISCIIILISIVLSSFEVNAQQREIKPLEIGAQAPDFNLPGIDGRNYSLADFADYEVLVVAFWANHCPTAQAYEDRLIEMVNKYRPKGVGFVVISPNSPKALSVVELGYSDLGDDLDDMKIRAEDKGYNFPYLYDGDDHQGSIPYGPVATPHVFIFDNERKLRYRGRIDDTENPYIEPNTSDARDAIEALLAGSEVPLKETPSFGCSIKWKWNYQRARDLDKKWSEMTVSVEEIDIEGIKKLIANDSENLRMINVWATWCGPCIVEFPDLVNIDRMYSRRNFEFISLSADIPSRKNSVLSFLKKKEAANRNYLYNSTDKYALIEAVDSEWQGALPHTLLIAPGGKIVARYAGVIDPLTVKRDIVGYLGRYYADN